MPKLNPLSVLLVLGVLGIVIVRLSIAGPLEVLPTLAVLGIIYYVVRRFRRGGGGITGAGASGTVDQIQSFPQEGQRGTSQSSATAMPAELGTLSQQVLERVKAGNHRLSVRVLADELGVSQDEIRVAVDELRESGLIQL